MDFAVEIVENAESLFGATRGLVLITILQIILYSTLFVRCSLQNRARTIVRVPIDRIRTRLHSTMQEQPFRFIEEVLFLLGAVAIIYLLGRYEHARVSKLSERKRIHGKYIPEWVAIGFAAPAVYLLFEGYPLFFGLPGAPGICFFGLLVGLMLGWIHGSIRLLLWKNKSPEKDLNVVTRTGDESNPFRPPTIS